MDIVAATNNRGKMEELRRLFEGSGYRLLSMNEAGISMNIEETGKTFAENALVKARAVCAACGAVALGDDSGLCVDALSGAPGVFSARFAGKYAGDEDNNLKLKQLLERTPYARRTARFICALAVVAPDGGVLEAQGTCEGMIGVISSAGKNGFGYDPMFYHNQVSFADMENAEKDAVSHRGAAVHQLLEKLPAFAVEHMPMLEEEE